MNLRFVACCVFLSIAFVAGCATTPTTTASTAPAVAAPPAPAAPAAAVVGDGPERELKQGMAPEDVKRIMGDPAEIRPMATEGGKAEVWIYRRTVNRGIEPVQVGTKPVTYSTIGSDGMARAQTVAEEPIFKQAIHLDVETVQLLIFDGHYLSQKQSVEKRLQYQ